MPSFIIVGYVRQTLEKWESGFLHSYPWAAPKMPILNRLSDLPNFGVLCVMLMNEKDILKYAVLSVWIHLKNAHFDGFNQFKTPKILLSANQGSPHFQNLFILFQRNLSYTLVILVFMSMFRYTFISRKTDLLY